MSEFRMPSLGADMTEGTLLEWLVAPGDAVRRGQIVAVIDTVKSAVDIEAFEDGEVLRLLVEPGTTVTVGTPLALLGTAEKGAAQTGPAAAPHAGRGADGTTPPHREETPVSPIVRHLAHDLDVDLAGLAGTGPGGGITRHDVEAAAAASAPRPEAPAPSSPSPSPSPSPTTGDGSARPPGRVPASPLARVRAAMLGVDLAATTGTGPGGAITVGDVEAAYSGSAEVPQQEAAPASVPSRRAPSGSSADERRAAMQAATGALMARSKREIPHYYLQRTIDLSATLEWLSRHNDGRSPSDRVLPAAVLLTATARCLLGSPELNGFYTGSTYEPSDVVDLGVAVSQRSGGLVVAGIRSAHTRSVDDVMAALKDVAARVRAGRLTSSEIAVPTVTVTNLGDQGADLVHGVIYPPQVALVGFGRIVARPWAVDGMLAVRPLVVASLAADHRVSDGHRGSRFLAALDAALQRPEEL